MTQRNRKAFSSRRALTIPFKRKRFRRYGDIQPCPSGEAAEAGLGGTAASGLRNNKPDE